MSWRTARWAVSLRQAGRACGLNRLLTTVVGTRRYEDRYGRLLMGAICEGDCVWDVGANVGLYTLPFAEKVGRSGRVYAFEPSPVNRTRLEEAAGGLNNVTILPVALGHEAGSALLRQGDDPIGATSRLVPACGEATDHATVPVERSDDLVSDGKVLAPNVIKIDTEGFELEVLRGMQEIVLREPKLRAVGVEVHFGLLARKGEGQAPAAIESLLRSAGLRLIWTDPSHLVGLRKVP